MTPSYRKILRSGLIDDNVVLVQMLALCPSMAMTATATNGLGMGLATTAVLILSNLLIAALRRFITPEVRIPCYIAVIAAVVTIIDMGLNAWMHPLYKVLGLFIPLIVANCLILERAEAFASKAPVLPSAVDGLAMGLGFTLSLTAIGAVREIIGSGTLFSSASLLLGPGFKFLETQVIPNYQGVLIMILPPGGFLTIGCLLALKRVVERKRRPAAASATAGADA